MSEQMTNEKVIIKSLPFRKETDPTFIQIQALSGATNGDMIEAMFPNAELGADPYSPSVDIFVDTILMMRVDRNWWNAPYKGVQS